MTMDPRRQCSECGRMDTQVLSYADGRRVCTGCGLITMDSFISDEPEWRTFEGGEDHSRVGLSASYRGLPNNLHLSTMGRPSHVAGDLQSSMAYAKHWSEIRRLADRWDFPSHSQDILRELFGIYRACRKLIRHMEDLCGAVIYYCGFLVDHPIPLNKLCDEGAFNRKRVLKYYRQLVMLTSGESKNRLAINIHVVPPPHENVEGQLVFEHLCEPSLHKRSLAFAKRLLLDLVPRRDFSRTIDLDVALEAFDKILNAYFSIYSTHRDPETIGAGVFYHFIRFVKKKSAALNGEVKLRDIKKVMFISESAINDVVKYLPCIKRVFPSYPSSSPKRARLQ